MIISWESGEFLEEKIISKKSWEKCKLRETYKCFSMTWGKYLETGEKKQEGDGGLFHGRP